MKTKKLEPKTATAIGIIVLVAAAVVYIFWNKIVALINASRTEKTLNQEATQYGAATLTQAQIQQLAQQIYAAMRGWLTDNSAVERVLSQMRCNADYAALRAAYAAVNKDGTYTTLDSRIAYEANGNRQLARWRGILDANGVTIYTF